MLNDFMLLEKLRWIQSKRWWGWYSAKLQRPTLRRQPQDFVCGMLAISQEEAEELAFVPSAFSEPRGSLYFCDNRCSEKAVRYWQFASVVVE